jgi:hypothetical protein
LGRESREELNPQIMQIAQIEEKKTNQGWKKCLARLNACSLFPFLNFLTPFISSL